MTIQHSTDRPQEGLGVNIEAIQWVLSHSTARGAAARLVHVAVASQVYDGWASVTKATLARFSECSMSEVTRCLRELEELGEIKTLFQGGDLGASRYEIRFQAASA
jgi:hypothetical protein